MISDKLLMYYLFVVHIPVNVYNEKIPKGVNKITFTTYDWFSFFFVTCLLFPPAEIGRVILGRKEIGTFSSTFPNNFYKTLSELVL